MNEKFKLYHYLVGSGQAAGHGGRRMKRIYQSKMALSNFFDPCKSVLSVVRFGFLCKPERVKIDLTGWRFGRLSLWPEKNQLAKKRSPEEKNQP